MVDAFTRRRVDGLILSTITEDQGYLHVEREQGTPLVFVGRPPIGLLADAVITNDHEAAIEATRHLINYGHRQIALLSEEPATSQTRGRQLGFVDAMATAGLAGTAREVAGLRSEQDSYTAVRGLMQLHNPPSALFTSHYPVTLGAVRALHELRLEQEIALIGFDDIVLADLLRPAISVMAADPTELGTIAAQRIFARLDGDTSPVETTVVPAKLIVRGSGEIPPADK
jgi:LacI family transcriptional regulator